MTCPLGDYLGKVFLFHFTDEKFQDLVYGFSSGPSLGELVRGTVAPALSWKKDQGWSDAWGTRP